MRDTSIFKRRETTISSGEYKNKNGGAWGTHVSLDKQPVTIVRAIPENGNEEEDDRFVVRTFGPCGGAEVIVDGCDLHPHPDSPLTNEEFIVLVMNWSQTAMMQPFILLAVEEYAKECLKQGVADTGFMSGKLWEETAREYLGWMAARTAVEEEKRKELTPAG